MCAASATSSTISRGAEKRLVFPVGEGPQGRADPGLLRRDRLPRLDPQGHRRAAAQGPASGVRAVEPGHARALRRHLLRLPHAEDQYKGATLSDHWVRSPVLNLKNACLGCHQKHDAKVTEKELKDRVEEIQDRHWTLRQQAMTALMGLIADLKAAKAAGRPDAELGHGALSAAPRAVLSRLRRGGELHRLPRAAGGRPHLGRCHQLRAPGPDRGARPDLQADRQGRRHPAAAGPAGTCGAAFRQAVRRKAGGHSRRHARACPACLAHPRLASWPKTYPRPQIERGRGWP